MIKLQRKLKKKIIKFFGLGTYKGIIDGYLTLNSKKGKGVIVKYTDKHLDKFYNEGQYHPHIKFKKIY